MLQIADLEAFEAYLSSGEFEDHFTHSLEGRRFEMLELLEKIMDLAELSDAVATRIIFKNSPIANLAGVKTPDAHS